MNDSAHFSARSVAWRSLAILVVVAILGYLDRLIISLMVEPIKASLRVSDFQIGLLQGVAFGAFYAIFGLPMGWLVDRYPRRLIIYFGTTCWSIATAACGLASTYWQLLAARFWVGTGEATLSPAAYSMIADLYPPRRLALALGIFATGSSIGAALAFIAGGAVIGELQKMGRIALPLIGVVEPWQMVFLLTGLPGLFIALLMFTVPEPVRTGRAAGLAKAAGFGEFLLMHWQYFTCHFLGYGLVAVLAYGAAAWMPAMLMRTYGLNVSNVGLILGAMNIFFGMPGFVVGGWIVDRWYAKGQADAHLRYFVIANVIGAGFAFIAFQVATTLWAMLAAYVVAHFLQPFTGPAVAHLQMVTPTEYRGRVSALFVMVFNLMGMCLGPPSVAFLTDYLFHDPQQVKSSLAVMYVGVALLAALVFALGLGPARRMVEGTRPAVLPTLATDTMEQANI